MHYSALDDDDDVGWRVVMHGSNGRVARQVLPRSLQWRSKNSRECSPEDCCRCMLWSVCAEFL